MKKSVVFSNETLARLFRALALLLHAGISLSDSVYLVKEDEDGAEAAAVTAVQMMLTGLPREEPKTLTLDRPFIYAITNNHTSEILFIGKVSNPQY